jgi:L-seryl-tRNA(Ser) seleniumtransferase
VAADKQDRHKALRHLPSIDRLLQEPETQALLVDFGRSLTVDALRAALESAREQLLSGTSPQAPSATQLISSARAELVKLIAPTLHPVINATGVIIHTNLGRAPLSDEAMDAIQAVAPSYSTLEYDPAAGERGSRTVHALGLLTQITGAEAAMVVNNNAAGVLLMLTALCRGREIIISRGQLIEIGGGFRVPDVMAQSGALLVEVGTTNRTHLRDYKQAINENTAAILVAHPSNYRVIGFTSEPSLTDLAELAHAHHIPLLFDQGSGALLDVTPYGLDAEPTVQEGLSAGVDIVAFSGDKLLGGPQAGLLCGSEELIARLKQHPLARAIRADKLCLSALTATLNHYLKGEALEAVPVWQMITRPLDAIEAEAEKWAAGFGEQGVKALVIDGRSRVGGGSLPGTSLPTKLVAIIDDDPQSLAYRLRMANTPVIGRIQDNRVLLDPRTVLPDQGKALLSTVLENSVAR